MHCATGNSGEPSPVEVKGKRPPTWPPSILPFQRDPQLPSRGFRHWNNRPALFFHLRLP